MAPHHIRRLLPGGLRSVVAATAKLEGSCLQLLRGVVVDG